MGTLGSSERPATSGITISFGERFAASNQFDAVFREGMALVERAAAYLDGPGRAEARQLRGAPAMLYATESMRLTTRLLELASWLMIRRAYKEGEITMAEVRKSSSAFGSRRRAASGHIKGFDELPEGLRNLITASFALNDRIVRLDCAMGVVVGEPEAAAASGSSPVEAQVARLEQAFAGGPRTVLTVSR